MWCGFSNKSGYVVTACLIAGSLAVSSTVMAARERNYTPREFRSVLYGLGYDVKISDAPLMDAQTKKAIRAFQRGYNISVDGIAGPQTQNLAANIVRSLKYNLNLVVNPNPKLTLNQFYELRAQEVVKNYQKQLQVEQTGIANLVLRQELNQKAKQNSPQPEPTSTPQSTPTPETTPEPTPSPTATPEVTPTPVIPKATPTPEATPQSTPTPEKTPETTPSPTATPEVTPTPVIPEVTPTPTETPTTTPTPTESPEDENEEVKPTSTPTKSP